MYKYYCKDQARPIPPKGSRPPPRKTMSTSDETPIKDEAKQLSEKYAIPYLDVCIEAEKIQDGARHVIKALRPDWDENDVIIETKSTGYCNINFSLTSPTSSKDGLFLRILNQKIPDHIETNVKSMIYLTRRGLGAQLLMMFKNGLVMELLEGDTITWDTFHKIKEPQNWLGLARELARYHGTTDLEDIKELGISSYKNTKDRFENMGPETHELVDKMLAEQGMPPAAKLKEMMDEIYEILLRDGAEIQFSHVDCNPTNVVLTPDRGVVLVDYDLCHLDLCVDPISVAFASVFNITAKLNTADLPTDQQKDIWLREYLKTRAELDPNFGSVTERMVKYWKFLLKKADIMNCVRSVRILAFMQDFATKSVDMSLSQFFWQKYQDNKEFLQRTFDE